MPAARLLLIVLAVSLATPAVAQDSGPAFAGIPNVTIDYYPVTGTSIAEIRTAMAAKGLRDSSDGSAVDALTRIELRWHWPGDGKRRCNLAKAKVEFKATVTMPRLADADAVPDAVRTLWYAFAAALAAHEAGHVRHGHSRVADMKAAILASDCAGANAAALAVVAETTRRDREYDRETAHGRLQGAVLE